MSARQIAQAIREGKTSSVELVTANLKAIDDRNPSVNALRYVARKEALALAKERDQELKNGINRGRLHGVTFSVKDHINVAGYPRTDGTLLYAEEQSASNAKVVQLLLDEGAICIGKGNQAEYGKSFQTENKDFGRTHNPYKQDYSPGGSGGGDAVAVALGFCCFGIGADAGGSIRIPASFCGLYGLHPSQGQISDAGLSATAHTISGLLRSLGVITRSAEDLELLRSILVKFDPTSHYSVPTPHLQPRPMKRCAVISELNGTPCAPEVQAAIEEIKSLLSKQGISVSDSPPPQFAESFQPFLLLAAKASLLIEDIVAQKEGTPRDPSKESQATSTLRSRVDTELPPLSPELLLSMWYEVDRLREAVAQEFESVDFILAPVVAIPPPKYGTSIYDIGSKQYQSQDIFQFASSVNLLGLPAVSFPVTRTKEALPVGLQLIGPRYSEAQLIELSASLRP